SGSAGRPIPFEHLHARRMPQRKRRKTVSTSVRRGVGAHATMVSFQPEEVMNMQRQRRQVRRSTPPVHLEVLEGRCLLAAYTVTDLGTLGGASSYAFGLNDVGQVVGVAKLANLQEHAFVWDNGVMTDLDPNGMVFGGRASSANSINEAGQIVGSGF